MKKTSIIFIILALIISLYGCGAPSFIIKSLDDKFSDSNQPFGTIGQNNRLSTKSSKGGTHIDNKGVYIDPFIFKDRLTNKIVSVGFYINHFNFELSDGFNPIEEIIFITDKNDRVSLEVKSRDFDYDIGSWNTITKTYNTTFSENGTATTTIEDFKKLINANWIEAKIIGRERTQTYDKDEVSNDFLINLKQFYNASTK